MVKKYAFHKLFTVACSLALFPLLASAQVYGPYEIDKKGTLATLTLTKDQKGSSGANFYFLTDNKVTSAVEAYLEGPPGMKLSIRSGSLTGKTPAMAVNQLGKLYQDPLFTGTGKSKQQVVTVLQDGSTTTTTPTNTTPPTASFTYEECMASATVSQIVAIYGMDKDTFCRSQSTGSSSGSTNSSSSPGQALGETVSGPTGIARAIFHMHKDECAAKGKKAIKHIGVLSVDYSGINPAFFDSGFVIKIGVKEYNWQGSRASSLKERGDGMFKEPLMLMASVASYGSEYFNLVRWAGGKVAGITKLPVAKYAGYKGLTLSVGRLGGKLKGGVATVELTDGSWIYSGGCFKMQAVRQSTNGYPTPN